MGLAPFDKHPADPDALSQLSSSLATQGANVLSLENTTKRAHAPVQANWRGIGNAEIHQAAQHVRVGARQVGGAVADAVVALASWAGSVRDFNKEVERIRRMVEEAGTGPTVASNTDQEIADIKHAALRKGKAEWHTAYENYIVAGRTKAVGLLKNSPDEEKILKLFQAGLLPMATASLYPNVDFTKTNWRMLFKNLLANGSNPLTWMAIGLASNGKNIPKPPPEPTSDAGAGQFNSDSWWTKGDDYAKKEIAGQVASAAELIGYTDAARHMRHYLDASGDDLSVDPDQIMKDVPSFKAAVDQTTSGEIERISQEASKSGTYGKEIPFSTKWQGHYLGQEENSNWFYAMGGIRYSVTGVAVVHAPQTAGESPQVEVEYKTHVWDRYNWDEQQDKKVEIGGVTIKDESLAEMHRAGVAREYDIVGESNTYHHAGEAPHSGQTSKLPEVDDGRGGGRDDPGRDPGPRTR